MRDKVLVLIAGNHHQAQEYIRQSGQLPARFRCVHTQQDILGMHPDRVEAVIRTGEHWLNPMSDSVDVRYLEQELTAARRGRR